MNPLNSHSDRLLTAAIFVVLAGYGWSAWQGWPQQGTARLVAAEDALLAAPAHTTPADAELTTGHDVSPPLWMVAPFALLLAGIAVLPLVPRLSHWWDSNLHKFYVAGGLGLVSLAYYLFLHQQPLLSEWPAPLWVQPANTGPNLALGGAVLTNALLSQYVPFMLLLLTLYTISGGIRIEGDLPAHPSTNALFLAIGALLANVIGTTGAAMLLVRPLLETNQQRKHVKHTVVFFIFSVCNCGGCLLPLGDPPLFLGYLRGVPFLWTMTLWPQWLFVNGLLVTLYYLADRFWYYPRETTLDLQRDETAGRRLRFTGLWPNVLLLAGVVLSVALLDPSNPFPGTAWHPWLYLREASQLALVAVSLNFGSAAARRANQFTYGAILEVAALFFGIFLCMQAPLQILHEQGPALGLRLPAHFFWASGTLSSVLDNAPTYVVFFETAKSLGAGGVAGVQEPLLTAISLGAVFMGAMTYIGNGPNFMVKAIAEKSGTAMPSFFGYMVYSCLILLPIFALTTALFL